jgi:citrate synthase
VGTGRKSRRYRALRQEMGFITYDQVLPIPILQSAIIMDGEKGILRYRGIPIDQLAEESSFVETSYLLINGKLPSPEELTRTSVMLNDQSIVHEDMQIFYQNFPRASHPMGILSAMVNALRSFYPELATEEGFEVLSRGCFPRSDHGGHVYKISRGHKVIYPRPDYTYCANFLNMMFDSPVKPYVLDQDLVKALNVFWILHADHEQNFGRSATVGMPGKYLSHIAGIAALWALCGV